MISFLLRTDLPVVSPLCHAVLKTLQRWEQVLQKRLEIFGGPPSKYISTLLKDETAAPGPALLRHKALFEPSNTPFRYWHELGRGTRMNMYRPFKNVFLSFVVLGMFPL